MHYISKVLIIYFLFPAKICPVRCLSLILSNNFSLKIPPRLYFSTCIITPVNFFDISHLFMSSTFIPYLRVSVTHEMYIYQLTSSQTHKMAIKNSQR